MATNTKQLSIALKIVLANTFVMLYKAESYHWNCQGRRFSIAHDFFKEQYDELFDAVDEIAEQIRILGEFPPVSMRALTEFATIKEDIDLPKNIDGMFSNYMISNVLMIESIQKLISLAELENDHGTMDLGISRTRTHEKTQWMLKSFLTFDTIG